MASKVYEEAYNEAIKTLAQPYGGASSEAFQNALKTGEINNDNFVSTMTQLGYAVETYKDSSGKTYIKDVSKTTIDAAPWDNAVSTIDSNTQQGTSGAGTTGSFYTEQPFATEAGENGKVNPADIKKYKDGKQQTGGQQNVGSGSKIMKVGGGVLQTILGYGVGLNLGKTVEKALYSADPDFWDAHGMENLDPDTWSEISREIDSPVGRFAFNILAGTETAPDGSTTATLYAEDTAQAYFAKWLQSVGFFDGSTKEESETNTVDGTELPAGIVRYGGGATVETYVGFKKPVYHDGSIPDLLSANNTRTAYLTADEAGVVLRACIVMVGASPELIVAAGHEVTGSLGYRCWSGVPGEGQFNPTSDSPTISYTYAGNTVYYARMILTPSLYSTFPSGLKTVKNTDLPKLAWSLWYGNWKSTTTGGKEGVSDQTGATVFDPAAQGLTDDSTVEDWKNAMKEVLPDLWNNRIEVTQAQPDGSTKTFTYIPLPIGQYINDGNAIQPYNDPTQQGQETPQTQPQIDPKTATDTQIATLIETLIKTVTQTPTGQPDPTVQPDPTGYVETDPQTKPKTPNPPTNPPDTGTGDTPTVVIPTGSASSLWAIYNPTLAQINSFGAWLWSPNFVDQILKLFSDPMQAIIGLHKIYCTPTTGAEQNIKVGYLDSGVPSKIVTDQYTTVDCGSVNLFEYFGNVFDYAPYTQLRLYLPFIGIVNLDTEDAMRGVIHVVYHVDVLSGACLAEVRITRDAAGGTLYQYAGNAAVTMPISSGSYIGVVANVVGVASSAIGGFASGGVAGGIAGGVTGALTRRGGTQVQHSGNFSGNAGAMGIKKPYLIIERPQTALADNYAEYIGNPSNTTVTLSSCTGYIKMKEVHLENVPATGAELSEIEQTLKQGVII